MTGIPRSVMEEARTVWQIASNNGETDAALVIARFALSRDKWAAEIIRPLVAAADCNVPPDDKDFNAAVAFLESIDTPTEQEDKLCPEQST